MALPAVAIVGRPNVGKSTLFNALVGRREAIVDDRPGNGTDQSVMEVVLSRENYRRLTVPPGLWMGFQGMGRGLNLLLNIADIPHDPTECEGLEHDGDRIDYRWSQLT